MYIFFFQETDEERRLRKEKEYKRRKEDAKLQREHDEAVRTRIEAESRRQLVYERVKFQQRVRDKIMKILYHEFLSGLLLFCLCRRTWTC